MPHQPGVFTSDKRMYLDRDGNVCEESDPNRRTLLVAAGGRLPMERARALGLVKGDKSDDSPESESKAQSEPPATKHISSPPANKGRE